MKEIYCIILLFFVTPSLSQAKKIVIENAEIQYKDEDLHKGATVLLGNVIITHDGIKLNCQKAFFYKDTNLFKAIGNVVINQGDTIKQTSNYADYNANTKQAFSWGNVVLKDPTMTLTTDSLNFDRLNQELYYKNYATIKDQTNTLNSKKGNYNIKKKKFTARTKVTIVNPEHILESNHLDYFTNSGLTYLYGSSIVKNTKNNNVIYSNKGFYNTKKDISHFVKNVKLYLNEKIIIGDSLYYDKRKGFASATDNIKIIDTVNNFIAKGNYAEIFDKADSLFIVKKAVAISIVDKDSTYIHGDTLLVTGKPEKRIIRVFHNVKIFKSDFQGKCDSIHTNQEKGLTRMFQNPIIWSERNQITGDTIHLVSNSKTKKLDSIKILKNAFIISKDSISNKDFNQIKGRNMFGKFRNGKLQKLLVKGNAESVYFNRNKDTKVLETITKQASSNIEFTLNNGEIELIKYLKKPDGNTYPPSKFPIADRKLKGFVWREEEQPKKMQDIFIKEKKQSEL